MFVCVFRGGGRLSVGGRFLLLVENKQIKKPGKSDCWDLVYFFFFFFYQQGPKLILAKH